MSRSLRLILSMTLGLALEAAAFAQDPERDSVSSEPAAKERDSVENTKKRSKLRKKKPASPATAPAAEAHTPAETQDQETGQFPFLTAGIKFLNFGYPTSGNVGLNLGANVWKIASLELYAERGNEDTEIAGVKIAEFSQSLYGGSARVFPFLGSFNVKGSYGQRILTTEVTPANYGYDTEVSVRQKVIGAALGNRFIGPRTGGIGVYANFDWIEIFKPAGDGKVSSSLLGRDPSDSDRRYVEDKARKLEDSWSITFVNMLIGFTW